MLSLYTIPYIYALIIMTSYKYEALSISQLSSRLWIYIQWNNWITCLSSTHSTLPLSTIHLVIVPPHLITHPEMNLYVGLCLMHVCVIYLCNHRVECYYYIFTIDLTTVRINYFLQFVPVFQKCLKAIIIFKLQIIRFLETFELYAIIKHTPMQYE